VGPAERAVFVGLPNSCSLGLIGPADGTLLELGTTQGVNRCNLFIYCYENLFIIMKIVRVILE